jgi:hypothetical protein
MATGVETPARPRAPPNFFASYEWLRGRSAYRVTFDRGNLITAAETAWIAVEPQPGDTAWWVGHDDAEAAFPLEPGDTIVVPAPEPGVVRIGWSPVDSANSVVLDQWWANAGDDS